MVWSTHNRQISSMLGISHGAVGSIIKKYKKDGSLDSSRRNCGRKRILSKRDLRVLELTVRRSPTKSSKCLQQELQSRGINAATPTIRENLIGIGLVSRIAPRKLLLTDRHPKLRLAFAKKIMGKNADFWRNVLFTGETRICIRNENGKIRLSRKTGERFKFVMPIVKHFAAVMMWGVFSAGGPGCIRFLSTCNAKWYLKVLEGQVSRSARLLFGANQEFCLQDDGAPCHRA